MPDILTTEFQFICPHKGIGTFPKTKQKFFKIGSGTVLLDGDTGIVACSPLICLTFSLESLKLGAVRCDNSHVMMTTDPVLTNTGFPLTIFPPPFVVANKTASIDMLKSGSPLPAFLGDESKPVVVLSAPQGPLIWKKDSPLEMTFNVTCQFLGDVDVRLISMSPKPHEPIPDAQRRFHVVERDTPQNGQHEIKVKLTPQHHILVFQPDILLMVRVSSQRGVSKHLEQNIVWTSQ